MKTKSYLTALLAGVAALVFAPGVRAADDYQSYSVPKDHPPIHPGAMTAPAGQQFETSGAPIHWTTPVGWKQRPATSMRIGNFLIAGAEGKQAEAAVTCFPGNVGGELDNVNRWRREIGLDEVTQEGIVSEAVTVDSIEGKLYNFAGPAASTLVVLLPREGATWFFKMRGDKQVVDGSRESFLTFLKSVRFGTQTAVADPHVRSTPTPAPPMEPASEPKWSPPAEWATVQSGPMVMKAFSVSGENGKKANVAISVFPGEVGGALANVNRWRAQLGLVPIQAGELTKTTESVHVEGGGAVMVDLSNPNAASGKPARLVAAIVPRDGRTWFYKLVGDDSVVAKEKDGFVKFVQTVSYP